jgi:enoyl-CoA hydratase/carnithine racemase
MIDRMHSCIAQVAGDRSVRAVVLAGQGRSFCTGVDVKGLREGSVGLEWFRAWHRMTAELEGIEVPVVAAIQGHCLGGGLMLTLAVDYRLAADDLEIGLGAVRHGILPGSAPQRLAGIVGAAAARRLCLFGEYVDGAEALRIGLVDRVVPVAELGNGARALAERAASFSPTAMRELKRLLREAPALDDPSYEAAYLSAQERCLDDEHGAARERP